MPRKDLAKKYWDQECERIYDETYEKIYKEHMSLRDPDGVKKGRHRWESEATDLGINYAEDAVDKYLIFKQYQEEHGI